MLGALAALLIGGWVIFRVPFDRPADRPFDYLGLTEEQARQIEDWAEAGRLLSTGDGDAFHKARDALMHRVLNDEQRRKYRNRASAAGWNCTNPWCPIHGRISSVPRIMGWIRRHLPPGWAMQIKLAAFGRAGFATGRRTATSGGAAEASFRIYVSHSRRKISRSQKRTYAGMPYVGSSAYPPRRWRLYASVNAPADEASRLLDLFRQACAMDYGRVKHGLRADLRDVTDPLSDTPAKRRKVGQAISILFHVTRVGNNGEWVYVGSEKVPHYLSIEVATPSGACHTLTCPAEPPRGSGPSMRLGWGSSHWRRVDLMKYPRAAELFSAAGEYKLKAMYLSSWPRKDRRLETNTLSVVLEAAD